MTIALTNTGAGNGIGGDAQNDAYSNFENIVGSAFVDSLTGKMASMFWPALAAMTRCAA
ncbi:hypothetical protein [Phyllobacterium lublinensis]|uniref:hypothetical protein n=1 Tax=Phyllobacterium lublinensis TaxID=2875708 RepID=UPI001CCEE227|nr:hypothetical protein [Phyllobacterium sp. 2063]MBZ9655312.1 hypothetical protein [Phyllobacterium sp. 2063]